MKNTKVISLAGAVALAMGLAACGTTDPYGPNNYPVSSINPNPGYTTADTTTTYVQPGSTTTYVVPAGSTVVAQGGTYVVPGTQYAVPAVEFGRVTNVQMISSGTRASGNSAGGAVVGGVVGGLLGNTVGGGAGRIAATILGAGVGAAVGSNLASRPTYGNYAGSVYRVWVQTDSGVMRTYDVGNYANLRPGDRVRIDNGNIYIG